MNTFKTHRTISLPCFSCRKDEELHLIDQKFTDKVMGVVENCMSNNDA